MAAGRVLIACCVSSCSYTAYMGLLRLEAAVAELGAGHSGDCHDTSLNGFLGATRRERAHTGWLVVGFAIGYRVLFVWPCGTQALRRPSCSSCTLAKR